MSWRSLRVRAGADRDAVLAALFAAGSAGVQEDAESLVTHFPAGIDVEALAESIRALAPQAAIEIGETPDVDWSRAWRGGLHAHRIGTLTIAPPWLEVEARGVDGAPAIVIDPGMAFGTGEHATTRGVLALMQRVIRPGDRVADIGAGSAILAIAAARLGAEWVAAIESDADAIGNAEENVARNAVADRVHVLDGDALVLLPLVQPVRVVLANIISSVLLQLMPTIGAALSLDGEAILSGILATERHMVLAALAPEWRIRHELEEGSWWTVAIARR